MTESRNAKTVLDYCVRIGILTPAQRPKARIMRTYAGRYQREEGYPSWSVHAPDMHTDVGSFDTLADIAQGVRARTAWAAENGLTGPLGWSSGWCLYPNGRRTEDWRGGWRG